MEVKMKKKGWTTVLLIITLMTASHVWAADQPPITTTQDYIIGPGDVLEISVWNNQALTRTVTVLPDGKIRFVVSPRSFLCRGRLASR